MTKKGNSQRNKTLKNLLRGTRVDSALLSSARNSVSPDSYQELIRLIMSNSSLGRKYFSPPYPKTYAKLLNVVDILAPTTLDRELLWAKSYLLQYAKSLQTFIALAAEFWRALLRDDFSSCSRALESIEEEYGVSLWLIKNKLAFLQVAEGLEEQKKYSEYVIDTSTPNGASAFISSYVSIRNEETITPKRFYSFFTHQLEKIDAEPFVKDYLTFHIYPNVHIKPQAISNILRIESAGAVIDYYETLLMLSRFLLAANYTEVFPALTSTLKALHKQNGDGRLAVLLFEIGEAVSIDVSINTVVVNAFNALLKGDNEEAYAVATAGLKLNPNNPDLIDIAARAAAINPNIEIADESTRYNRIMREMRAVYAFSENTDETVVNLERHAVNFDTEPVADSALRFIVKQQSSNPLEEGGLIVHYTVSGSAAISPVKIGDFPSKLFRQRYAEFNRVLYGESTATLYADVVAGKENIDAMTGILGSEEFQLLAAETALRKGDVDSALDKSLNLLGSASAYYVQKAIRLVSHCFFKLGRIGECVDFIVTSYIKYGHPEIMPLENAVGQLDKSARRAHRANISLPIIFDIYLKHIGTGYEDERRYAYEDFLFANGVQKPSELRMLSDRFKKDELIYFLRYIAVEPVMDVSTVFAGSREIAEERISVCRFLAEFDRANSNIYQTEIRGIVRKLMIKQRLIEVQQSKIYVDIDSIKKKIGKEVRESFNRYKALLAQRSSDKELALRNQRREKASSFDIEGLLKLPLPTDEINNLIESIVIQLRDQFVSSNEHGLDGYLSVRIRHGTLRGELRGPLEQAQLLIQRDAITGGYKIREGLQARLGKMPGFARKQVMDFLVEFTGEYDQLIYELISEWIQIKKVPSDKGLFDFTLLNIHTELFEAQVTAETTFDQFLDMVFNAFLETLEYHLVKVRHAITFDAKQRATTLLTKLQKDTEALSPGADVGELVRTIVATQTEVQRAFNRIIEWFRFSQSTAKEPFMIEDAVQISLESVQTFTHGIDAEIEGPDVQAMIVGQLLNAVVDILSIVFENVLRHANVSGRPLAHVSAKLDNNLFGVRIENEVGDGVFTESNIQKINGIKRAILENQYGHSVSKEGGTGFHKIWKILNHDIKDSRLNKPAELDFGFISGNRFFVDFSIPAQVFHLGKGGQL